MRVNGKSGGCGAAVDVSKKWHVAAYWIGIVIVLQ